MADFEYLYCNKASCYIVVLLGSNSTLNSKQSKEIAVKLVLIFLSTCFYEDDLFALNEFSFT